jgi:hypothetical protein
MTAFTLVVSVAVSWSGAQLIGLTGAAIGSVLAVYLDRAIMLTRVARLTGTGLRRVQNWRALGWALGTALIAAALAWIAVETLLAHEAPFMRLLVGTLVLGGTYVAMNWRKLRR